MTSWWARLRLKPPASRLFTQQYIQGANQRSASLAFVLMVVQQFNPSHVWSHSVRVKSKTYACMHAYMNYMKYLDIPQIQTVITCVASLTIWILMHSPYWLLRKCIFACACVCTLYIQHRSYTLLISIPKTCYVRIRVLIHYILG